MRILAEEEYGNREFWIYIYLKNKHLIENPNRVPRGLELTLPQATEYDIDASNPASIEKASHIADELIGLLS